MGRLLELLLQLWSKQLLYDAVLLQLVVVTTQRYRVFLGLC